MAINFNGSYSQTFDSLLSSGTGNAWSNDVTIPGWFLFRQPVPGTDITAYNANNGSSTTGSFYSYGDTDASDRALGGLGSGGAYFGSPATGAIAGWIAFAATNTTGTTLNQADLAFNGEQWRNGGNITPQTIVLEYGFGSTFDSVTTWTAPGGSFDSTSPVATATAGVVDGNGAGLIAGRGGTLSNLGWNSGDTLWIRWVERNDAASDHGLAIDNISLTTGTTPPPTTTLVTIAATDATAAEAGTDPGIFRISRTGDTTDALTVEYVVATGAGQATTGTDYTPALTGTATIAAGQAFIDITVTPVDDDLTESSETVTLTLTDTTAYDLGAATTATVTIADNDAAVGATRIRDIQGMAHISPLLATATSTAAVQNVPGIVTAIAPNGFYIQDPSADTNAATSEAIFVFTGSTSPIRTARVVGEAVLVTGTVSEFRPGGSSNNLTTTQISNNNGVQALGVTAWTTAPTTTITPTVIGNGGRVPPNSIINNDFAGTGNVETGGDFDPATEGIDFYESLEGMLVQINNPVATSPTANFGSSEEIWVLADNGTNATSVTANGGSLITSADFNPERIQIDDLDSALVLPSVNVGAQLSTITGVVNYDFNNYEVLVATAPTVVQASSLQKEVTTLTGSATQLTVATFNVENLDPADGADQFNALAQAIVNNLKSPDILNLEEIQDNNGAINNGVVDASVTFQTLIDAIAAAGGPTYEFRQIDPVNNQDGGQPGGNIRVGFLFNPNRVDFVEGSLQRLTDTDLSDGDAFASSRKPLVGTFTFNGQDVTVVGNHFNSKGGDQPLFGPNQPPILSSEIQRNQQATIVRDFVRNILTTDPNANVVVAGDINDFEFSNPVTILEDNGNLNTLIETLPANERYTYNFQGNAQVLDHILVSDNLLSNLAGFDVVHFNSEFADQISDHDPVLARFNFAVPNAAPTAVGFVNAIAGLPENSSTASRVKVADIAITDDGLGTNVLSLSGADASFFELDSTELFLKANTVLNFEAKPSYAVTVNADDSTVGSTPDVSNTFTLALTDVNEAPAAVNDGPFSATLDTALTIPVATLFVNDTDVDANTVLQITSVSNASNGSVALNDNGTPTDFSDDSVIFTPTRLYLGAAAFEYTLSDGSLTDTATVALNVALPNNAIQGNNGNNNLNGNGSNQVFASFGGNDTVNGNGGNDTFLGGDGNDTLNGGGGNDGFDGGNGNDQINGNGGNDYVLAGAGNDRVNGGSGDDFVDGGAGNDVINGNGGNDTLLGGAGNDSISSGGGDNLINGGVGNDTIQLGSGRNIVVLEVGEGFDSIRNFQLGSTRFDVGTGALSFVKSGNGVNIFQNNDRLAFVENVSVNTLNNNQATIFV